MFPYLVAGAIGFVVAKLFEEDEAPKYADGGIVVGENEDDNKFPTKEEAFELIQDSIDSQGTYFIDEDGDGMFESREQAQKYVDEIYDFFDYYYSLGMIPVYRGISSDEVDLDPYSIGESWSLYLDNAKQFATHLGTSKNLKIISAYVPNSNVDWESAFRLYPLFSDFGDGDSEFELPIPANNKLFDVKVSDLKEAKELEPYKYTDGGSVLLAPNGKPSNLTPEQYKLVREPAFKKWFGDWEKKPKNASKVVDSNGEPLVVYHGTNEQFNVFSKKGKGNRVLGFFFTTDKEFSENYGESKLYFLNIKNIKNFNYEKFDSLNTRQNAENNYWQLEKKKLLSEMYNGVLIDRNDFFAGINFIRKDYVAFEPEQIKLADGTNTTFDAGNPDIRYAGGGSVDDAISKLTSVTPQQKSTIERIVSTIERANGKQTISVLNIRKGHIVLLVFNVRDKVESITTTTYCDVEINTKGNVTKGFYNYLTPKVETKYPYMEKGGLIAPNGKPSNLTPEQYKLVRLPEFKAWFGDWENDPANASKVVDDNGEPLIVYHATNKTFNFFDKNKLGTQTDFGTLGRGFYFDTLLDIQISGEGTPINTWATKIILKCFLNIKNPKISKDNFSKKSESIKYTNNIIKDGYDGILEQGYYDGRYYPIWYVAFEPEQIKLADGTNTTFDGNNPDIRYAGGGNVDNKTLMKNDFLNEQKELQRNSKYAILLDATWDNYTDEMREVENNLAYELIKKLGYNPLLNFAPFTNKDSEILMFDDDSNLLGLLIFTIEPKYTVVPRFSPSYIKPEKIFENNENVFYLEYIFSFGKGNGQKMMNQIKKYADKYNVQIGLEGSVVEKSEGKYMASAKHLKRFYDKQGFENIGGHYFIYIPNSKFAGGGDVKKVKFSIEEEEERTTISIKGIGEVILVETFPEYEFLEDVGEDGLEELGVEEGDMIGKIEHLEIDDKYKGKGYAKLLMNKAIEVAEEKGLMPLYLNASPMGSKRYGLNLEDLTGFYESFGFEVFLQQGNNNLMILK
jgi:GNAT superfamily N-acetyltransferase